MTKSLKPSTLFCQEKAFTGSSSCETSHFAMVNSSNNTNSYEEARKQRLQDNKKRFEDLGISKISESLSEDKNSAKRSLLYQAKRKSNISAMSCDMLEPRRSSRARNPISSYYEEVNIGLPPLRKRSISTSWKSYLARPLDEVKFVSDEDRAYAIECAENFQSSLRSRHPSFVKSMVRSHVYSCFWLGLPIKFCKDHLPSNELNMVLEDEKGSEFDAIYIGSRRGLSGGWRGFALDHKLDDGDALVFELIEPTRFKVYIVKAHENTSEEKLKKNDNTKVAKSKKPVKVAKNADVPVSQNLRPEGGSTKVSKNGGTKAAKLKKAVKVVKNDDDFVFSKLQPEDGSGKLFRKKSISSKLFRKKCT